MKLEDMILVFTWIVWILISTAFFTLSERKSMAGMQRRIGPNVVGFVGLLQPVADGLKAICKELILPLRAYHVLFFLGPIVVFALSLSGWAVIPLSFYTFVSSIDLAIIYSLIAGGLTVYGLILAGWSSNSRYAFLGSVRATAQMVSYELVLGTVNIFIAFFVGSFNYVDIIQAQKYVWFVIPLFPLFITYCIIMLAETNRTPFDLSEAEAELVAGYNVEYSSIMFAMFFLGEYSNMILLSVICVLYFFGGWNGFLVFFLLKVLFFCFFFIWVRATLPRYRYDQLMDFGWKHLLPFLFGLLIFMFSFMLLLNVKETIELYSIQFQQLLFYIYCLQLAHMGSIFDLQFFANEIGLGFADMGPLMETVHVATRPVFLDTFCSVAEEDPLRDNELYKKAEDLYKIAKWYSEDHVSLQDWWHGRQHYQSRYYTPDAWPKAQVALEKARIAAEMERSGVADPAALEKAQKVAKKAYQAALKADNEAKEGHNMGIYLDIFLIIVGYLALAWYMDDDGDE